ncbi:hypothetical protein VH567_05895 [Sphingomonas sp. 4RDLI-65]|uniref:hypothetical protein n=1 Tax=Sphingomonas sp. 4RDLI-65 TaxID=3111641 RepID=UPI003C20EC63
MWLWAANALSCALLIGAAVGLMPLAARAQDTGAQVGAQAVTAQTLAGTPIVNTAGLRFDLNGTAQSTVSNTVTIIVAERLDVGLVRNGQGGIVVAAQPTVVPLTLTNMDNGRESFVVAASVSSGPITLRALVTDANGDGLYDPAIDLAPVDGRTPVLAPGQSIALLAIVAASGGATGATATLTVTAQSSTGSGSTGSAYAGLGDGGSDAVVGPTGAIARVAVPLTTALSGPALFKSQSVRAADGSQNAVRDAVITYTLEARFTDAVAGARILDPIPGGTAFVPGSLVLDGTPLTDAGDGDAGRFDPQSAPQSAPQSVQGGAIAVALGQVAAASVHTVQFKAKIQ